MPTWQYLWRPAPEPRDRTDFASRARAQLSERLEGLGASALWLHVTEEEAPRLALIPFRREAVALVTVQGESADLGARAGERLQALPGAWSGYRVTEAQPVPRRHTAPRAARSPGACLLTVFRRHPRLSRERFLSEWHGKHTPMSLEIHPLTSYVRNVVEEPVLPGSPPWEGIVTESFASRAALLNPLRLFGGPMRAPLNMIRVGLHIRTFMDLRSMETYLVSEYCMKG